MKIDSKKVVVFITFRMMSDKYELLVAVIEVLHLTAPLTQGLSWGKSDGD